MLGSRGGPRKPPNSPKSAGSGGLFEGPGTSRKSGETRGEDPKCKCAARGGGPEGLSAGRGVLRETRPLESSAKSGKSDEISAAGSTWACVDPGGGPRKPPAGQGSVGRTPAPGAARLPVQRRTASRFPEGYQGWALSRTFPGRARPPPPPKKIPQEPRGLLVPWYFFGGGGGPQGIPQWHLHAVASARGLPASQGRFSFLEMARSFLAMWEYEKRHLR